MTDSVANILAPRSRVPINQAGIRLWEGCENDNATTKAQCIKGGENCTVPFKRFHDKSTSTDLTTKIDLTIVKNITVGDRENKTKDTVLKKWRERQAKAKHQTTRRAAINSLKEKFRGTKRQANLDAFEDGNKDYIHRSIPTVALTEDVEDTSNLNVNHDAAGANLDCKLDDFTVDNALAEVDEVCHARKLQMGPGGELAQWRLAARGSRAAGAEGGLRGNVKEVMPVFNVVVIACSLSWFSVFGIFSTFHFTIYDIYAVLLSTTVLILFIFDVLFNLILIVSIHKKHSTLSRLFYRYGIVHTILLVAIGLLMIASLLFSASEYRRGGIGNIIVVFLTICFLLIVFHMYLLPLVRNEGRKTKPNDHIQFVVQNADPIMQDDFSPT